MQFFISHFLHINTCQIWLWFDKFKVLNGSGIKRKTLSSHSILFLFLFCFVLTVGKGLGTRLELYNVFQTSKAVTIFLATSWWSQTQYWWWCYILDHLDCTFCHSRLLVHLCKCLLLATPNTVHSLLTPGDTSVHTETRTFISIPQTSIIWFQLEMWTWVIEQMETIIFRLF